MEWLQTEFSHLSPETPASLLEQGEAYATALDGFSEHFETPDATRTAPPIQDNVRSNFRQEASRRSFVTEDVTDHDTGKYAPSSEGSAPPNGTDRSGQEHRYRTHQHGNKYQQRFQEAAQAEEQAAQKEKGMDSEPPKTSKLEFTADELPPEPKDKKLTHARRRAERTAQKAEQAQDRLPARKKLRMETVSDPETGKAKKHLKFEKEVKSQKAHVKGPVPLRPVKAGANTAIGYAHKKIYEAEDENVGIKAAHRSELVGEAGLRTAYHRHKTAPYRKAAKLQQKSAKANARLAHRQALSDHPELKKHAIARMWQKQKLKRQYAKAARGSRETGQKCRSRNREGQRRYCPCGQTAPCDLPCSPASPFGNFPDHVPVFYILQYRNRRSGKSGCFYLSCRRSGHQSGGAYLYRVGNRSANGNRPGGIRPPRL